MEISARRVLTFKPSQVLKEDVTVRYGHRLDEKGNEDKSIPAREGTSRALSFSSLILKMNQIINS